MVHQTFSLPTLSPSQARDSPSSFKSAHLQVHQFDSASTCSTAASDLSSQPGDITDSEHDSLSSPKEVCSNDVEWLLSCLSENEKRYLDRSAFYKECQRIFKNNDKDDNGFLDTQELQEVFDMLIPDSHRNLANAAGQRLVLSIKSAIAAFDKDSDRQLSADEFCEFVRFCYAWRSQYESMPARRRVVESCSEVRPGTAQDAWSSTISPLRSPSTPSGSGYRLVQSLSSTMLGSSEKPSSLPSSPLPSRPSSPAGIQVSRLGSSPEIRKLQSSTLEPSPECRKLQSSLLARHPLEPLPCANSYNQKLSRLVSNRVNSKHSSRKVSPEPQARASLARNSRTRSRRASRKASPEPQAASLRRPGSSSSFSRPVPKNELSLSASEPNLSLPRSSKSAASRSLHPPEPSRSAASSSSSRASSTTPRFGSQAGGEKTLPHERLARRQLQALKALVRELLPSHTSLEDLVITLLSKVDSLDNSAAFPIETQQHVCKVVMKGVIISDSPEKVGSTLAVSPSLAVFFEHMHHSATPLPANKTLTELIEEPWFLEDRAIEVMTMLSLRWTSIKDQESLPQMTEYAQRRWLPSAFSCLVGQILWRNRAAASLQRFESDVENSSWVTFSMGERVVDDFNRAFKYFAGSNNGVIRPPAFRRVIDIFALNPELRPGLKRCDSVRAYYADIAGRSEQGMQKKHFKIFLMKVAEMLSVHPATLFIALAYHINELELSETTSM